MIVSVLHHVSPLLTYYVKSCHLDDTDNAKTVPIASEPDVKWSIDVSNDGRGQWIERQLQSLNTESLEILRHHGKLSSLQVTRSSHDL